MPSTRQSRCPRATGCPGAVSTVNFWMRRRRCILIGPLAVVLIFMILFALYGNFKFPVTIALGVIMTEPVGALMALKLTHTPFSVSSVLGLLALLGRVGRNRGHSGFLHQQAPAGRNGHPHRNPGGLAAATSPHHDDGVGRMSRTAPGGACPPASARTRRSPSPS